MIWKMVHTSRGLFKNAGEQKGGGRWCKPQGVCSKKLANKQEVDDMEDSANLKGIVQ